MPTPVSPFYALLSGDTSTTGSNGSSAKKPITFTVSIITATGTTSTTSQVVTAISSTTGIADGMLVTGTGIPAGTTVTSIGTGTVTLSQTPTVAATETLTFTNAPVTGHTMIGVIKMAGGGVLDQSGTSPATSPIVDPRNTWTIEPDTATANASSANVAFVICPVTTPYQNNDVITAYSTVNSAYNTFCIIDIAATLTVSGTPVSAQQTSSHSNDSTNAAAMEAASASKYMLAALATAAGSGSGKITVTNSTAGANGASPTEGWNLLAAVGNASENCAIAELLAPSTTANSQAQWSWTGTSVSDATAIIAYTVTPLSDTPPVAVITAPSTTPTNSLVSLSASSSYGTSYGDTISSYAWSITSKPSGSSATLSSTTAESPTFTADKAGSYTVHLVVTDQHSVPSSAVTATISSATTVRRYWDGAEAVELRITTLLPGGIFV